MNPVHACVSLSLVRRAHAIINFKQHDVAIPITVLEELDKFKLGNDTKNFSAREVIRFIDKLVGNERLSNWIDIEKSLTGIYHKKL